ncbi:MAG: hypothetical protein D6683_07150 [Actinomyces sp.]|nr:MAG: hypothetical protein D6683_07150 [Actinomyces sp.]
MSAAPTVGTGGTGGEARPPWRRRLAAVTLVGAVAVHLALIVNGGADPHKRFGFRPFEDSDVWQAEIVRVTADGRRLPVDDGTWVYDWNELVGVGSLASPWRPGHARGGARAIVDLLDRALDWVVRHIPDDPDTVRLEARVTVIHNRHDPRVIILTGDERETGP